MRARALAAASCIAFDMVIFVADATAASRMKVTLAYLTPATMKTGSERASMERA